MPPEKHSSFVSVDSQTMQIRSRLTLQFLLIVAGIMLVAMLYIYFQFKTHLQNEFCPATSGRRPI